MPSRKKGLMSLKERQLIAEIGRIRAEVRMKRGKTGPRHDPNLFEAFSSHPSGLANLHGGLIGAENSYS